MEQFEKNEQPMINKKTPSILLTRKERLSVLKKIAGALKQRTPDPAKELKKLRKDWDRKLLLKK